MSTFGNDLIRSLEEAVLHAKEGSPAIVHLPATPQDNGETDTASDRGPVASKPADA